MASECSRRVFLKAIGLGIGAMSTVGCGVSVGSSPGSVKRRPNIILFLVDDMGWGDPGVFGHPYAKTPNINKMAKGGTVFENFYVTSPVCSPSRASFMTGHFPARHRVHTAFGNPKNNAAIGMPDYLDPGVNLISRTVRNNGYKTAHFGKWHLCGSPKHLKTVPNPSKYDFDYFRTYHTYFPDVTKDHHFIRGADKELYRARSSKKIVDATLKVMKENKDKPVYINAWTLVPHATLYPEAAELAVYADLEPKAEDFSEHMRKYIKEVPADELKERMQIYCATITSLDTALGELIAGIEQMGQKDNTLILLVSDNGPEDRYSRNVRAGVGSPGGFRGRKRSIYEGGVRTSCVAYWPGTVAAGRVDKTSVISGVDWPATVCGLTGIKPKSDFDGEDVSDILKGKSRPRKKPLFWEWRYRVRGDESYHAPQLAIRDGKWKFLCNPDGSNGQLYNIPADPSEKKDVVKANPEIAVKLKKKLLEWKKTLPK